MMGIPSATRTSASADIFEMSGSLTHCRRMSRLGVITQPPSPAAHRVTMCSTQPASSTLRNRTPITSMRSPRVAADGLGRASETGSVLTPVTRFSSCLPRSARVGRHTEALEIGSHHDLSELVKLHCGTPTKLRLGFAAVADEHVNVCRPVVPFVDSDRDATGVHVAAHLRDALALPLDAHSGHSGSGLDELAHGVSLSGGDHIVVGLVLLQHQPHAVGVVPGVAPVAARVHIAQRHTVLQTRLDPGQAQRDLTRNEVLASTR